MCLVLFSKVDLLFLIPVISSTSSSDEDEEVGDDSDRELAQPPDAVKSGPERIHVRLWEEKHWVKGKNIALYEHITKNRSIYRCTLKKRVFLASVSLVDLGALIMRKVFQQNHRPALSIFLGFVFSILIAVMPMINRLYVKYKVACKNCTENSHDLGTVLILAKFDFIFMGVYHLEVVWKYTLAPLFVPLLKYFLKYFLAIF